MKSFISLFFICLSQSVTSFAQQNTNNLILTTNFKNTTCEQEEVEEMRNAAFDRGHWIGTRGGVQTNGGDIIDRWIVTLMYEWKYSNTFSLPLEFQIFQHRAYAYNEFGQYGKVLETRPMLSIGLKARVKLSRVSPYGQVGLEQLSGIGFYLRQPFYAIGTEIFLTDKIFLNLNIRKGIIPDYQHFISLGININIAPFIR